MNTLELSNVELSADLQAELVERKNRGDTHEVFVNSTIDPVIQRLATLNPSLDALYFKSHPCDSGNWHSLFKSDCSSELSRIIESN